MKKRVHHALFLVVLCVMVIGGGFTCRYFWPEAWMNVRSKSEVVLLGSVLVPYLVLLVIIIGRTIGQRKNSNKEK